ncbi:MAG: dienelactone hydrolase family protein [Rhodospirillales bacterium]
MISKQSVHVKGSEMEVWLSQPEGDGPFPALIFAIHAPANVGIENDPFTLDLLERYAAQGYVCAAPFIFHWWPKEGPMESKRPQLRDDHLVMDINAAFSVLEGMDNVDTQRIGILGHCMGGRIAWLAACHNDRFKALVVLYGGRIKTGAGEGATAPIDLAANIPCPVLGLFGNDDQNPSPADVDDYEAALKAAGVDYIFHRYDDTTHAFQDFSRPERYNAESSDDAQDKIFAFLHDKLKSGH